MAKQTNDKIVWLDMEMTGLDPDEDHILEIACFVTDKELNIISSTFHVVIHQPPEILLNMTEWCKKQHKKSGLIKESQASSITTEEAGEKLLKFLKTHTSPGGSPLAGSTIYMDKLFLMKQLPQVAAFFHYRVIDVSSILELCRRWYSYFRRVTSSHDRKHRAASDIQQSLNELKNLREKFFVKRRNQGNLDFNDFSNEDLYGT